MRIRAAYLLNLLKSESNTCYQLYKDIAIREVVDYVKSIHTTNTQSAICVDIYIQFYL
jgi:hypothetical protein